MTRTMVGAQEPPDGPEGRLGDPHAERAVLGAVVSGGPLAKHLLSVLEEGDFTVATHQDVFAAAAALTMHARRIDPVTVHAESDRLERPVQRAPASCPAPPGTQSTPSPGSLSTRPAPFADSFEQGDDSQVWEIPDTSW